MSIKKLLNADAQGTNILKLHDSSSGCCGKDGLSLCKYVIEGVTIADGVTNVIFTVDGADVTKTFTAVTTISDLKKKVNELVREMGYDPYYADNYIGIKSDGTNVIVISELEFKSMEIDSSTEAFTKLCTSKKVCTFEVTVDASTSVAPGISLGGQTATAIGDNAGYAGAAVATFESELTTAITTQLLTLSTSYKNVSVTYNAATDDFTVRFDLEGAEDVVFAGASLVRTRCFPDWIAA